MDMSLKEQFLTLWKKYFNNAELPITFYYTEKPETADVVKPGSGPRCIIGGLVEVRRGTSQACAGAAVGGPGGRRYLGFAGNLMPEFEYFLSCGIPGKLEGERYKKTPEIVKETMKEWPVLHAPAKYIVFKRWDALAESDRPDVVIFFGTPDVLSGLFTLAGYDEVGANAVYAPFGSGCSSIVQNPYLEKDAASPRGIIGMFDVSARPFVPENVLTFSVPMVKFQRMVDNMDESFLITRSWEQIQKRIK